MKTLVLSTAVLALTLAAPLHAAEDGFAAFVTENAPGWMADPTIVAAIAASNDAHATIDATQIAAFESTWRAELEAADKPLVSGILNAPASAVLRDIVAETQGAVVEIILMDNRGLNVGISAVTSDYWQGDEDKYQQTFEKGAGAVHIGEVELDDSTGTYVVQVSMTLADTVGTPVGAVTFSLDAEQF